MNKAVLIFIFLLFLACSKERELPDTYMGSTITWDVDPSEVVAPGNGSELI